MNIEPGEISADGIRELLTRTLIAGNDESDRQCIVKGPLVSQDKSRIFYAECLNYTTPVAVKCCLKAGTVMADPVDAGQQFHGLQRVFEKMAGGGEFSVPIPYQLFEREGIYVTEWIPGKNLTDELFSRSCTREHALDLMTRAAHWLRCFHAAHRLSSGCLDVEEKLEAVAELEKNNAPTARAFHRGIDALRSAASAAGKSKLERSWVHGDFKADNLIVSGARVVGIDVYVRHENTVIHDLAPFMNHIDLSYFGPRSWRSPVGSGDLRDAFLRSYLGAASGVLALPLVWLRLYMMLYRWSYLHEKAMRFRSVLLQYCIQRCVRRLSSDLPALC